MVLMQLRAIETSAPHQRSVRGAFCIGEIPMSRHHRFALAALALLCALSFSSNSQAADDGYAATAATAGDLKSQLQTYFFAAAREGRSDMLQEFINAGYDLNTRDGKGYTAIILAAYHGRREAVNLLISAGADACAEDHRGNTALMGAIFKGELSIARTLLDADCKPDQRNAAGQTPAMIAALFGRVDLLKTLQGGQTR